MMMRSILSIHGFSVEIKNAKRIAAFTDSLEREGKSAKDDCHVVTVQLHQEGKVHNYKRNSQGKVRFFLVAVMSH